MDQDTFNKLMMGVDLDQALDQATKDAMQTAIAISPTQQAIIDNDALMRDTQMITDAQIDQPQTLNNDQISLRNVPKNLGNYIAEKLYLKESPGRRAERLRGDLYQYQAAEVQNEMMQDLKNQARSDFDYSNFLDMRQKIESDKNLTPELRNRLLTMDQETFYNSYGNVQRPLTDEDIKKYNLPEDAVGTITPAGDIQLENEYMKDVRARGDSIQRLLTRKEKLENNFDPRSVVTVNELGAYEVVKEVTYPSGQMYDPVSKSIINVPGSKREREVEAEERARKLALENENNTIGFITDEINMALDIVNKDTGFGWGELPVTGFGAELIAENVGGSDARDLAVRLDTLKSYIARDKLQEMRESSPTGGALGNVSNFEVEMLQAAMGSLSQGQTKESLKYNLERLAFLMRIITNPDRKGQGTQSFEYNGKPIFYLPNNPEDAERYRNEILQFNKNAGPSVKFNENEVFSSQGVTNPQIGGTSIKELTDEQIETLLREGSP